MFRSLRVRASQGSQFITDLRKAVPQGFRGRPRIGAGPCKEGCDACVKACPTGALAVDPLRLDLGLCVFCAECVEVCPASKLSFTPETRMGSATREGLVLTEGHDAIDPVETSKSLSALFGRSLRLRQVSAGGCNGCELELNAIANVNFDLQRYGIEWVATPRHADALVLSGPLTSNMAEAVRLAWDAMPDPRFLVSFGACAISGGLYAEGAAVDRRLLDEIGPALYVPGCPPHPLTFVHAILELLGITR
jgi:Ni,Fe-hydrogenase III small subunit/NAD-dependent dihydropyrimidine dehydrogenase PreA subunit